MGISCGGWCAKLVLMVWNGFILLCGLAMLGVGAWLLADPHIIQILQVVSRATGSDVARIIAIVALTIGVIMTTLGFLAFCGACCESKCLLYMFIFCSFIIIIGQLLVGILAVMYRRDISKELKAGMDTFVRNEYDGRSPLSISWNGMQTTIKCCGANGTDDWKDSRWFHNPAWNPQHLNVPLSCCVMTSGQPLNTTMCQSGGSGYIHTKGCHPELSRYMELFGLAISISLLVLMVFQMMVVSFACCLICSINSKREVQPIPMHVQHTPAAPHGRKV